MFGQFRVAAEKARQSEFRDPSDLSNLVLMQAGFPDTSTEAAEEFLCGFHGAENTGTVGACQQLFLNVVTP